MKLLLHSCCADCTIKFIESIRSTNNFDELEIYYYNPNIHPRSEYQSRLKAMQIMASAKNTKLLLPDWKPAEYFNSVKSSKKPQRCLQCWSLRLENTAKYAKMSGFTHFSSTLLTSQYQDGNKVIEIGKTMAKKYDLDFFVPQFVCKELKTSGFYKQIFCGCCYSLTERFEEKFKNE